MPDYKEILIRETTRRRVDHAQSPGGDERDQPQHDQRNPPGARRSRTGSRSARRRAHRRRARVFRRHGPGQRARDGAAIMHWPYGIVTGETAAEVDRLLARRSAQLSPHVGVRQADHRRDQRLGHGRGLLAVALHPHHHRVGERGLRPARSAPRLEHELHVDAARRLQERAALRSHRRPHRRPGSAAHRPGGQSRAGRSAHRRMLQDRRAHRPCAAGNRQDQSCRSPPWGST